MATLAIGALGALAGGAAAYGTVYFALAVQIGFAVGTLIGSWMYPTKLPTVTGPRLEDLKVQTVGYGQPITETWGRDRVAGNVIWAQQLEEVTNVNKVGGKGMSTTQTQITYSYFGTFSVGFGAYHSKITSISRIWADKKLIYDITEIDQYTDVDDSEAVGLSGSVAFGESNNFDVKASDGGIGLYDEYITIHLGEESQLPSSLMESFEGVGNVPGHRGIVRVDFNRLPLEDWGNHIPQIEVEYNGNGQAYNYWKTPLANIEHGSATLQTMAIDPVGRFVYHAGWTNQDGYSTLVKYDVFDQSYEVLWIDTTGSGNNLIEQVHVGPDGYIYCWVFAVSTTTVQIWKFHPDTGTILATGDTGVPTGFGYGGRIGISKNYIICYTEEGAEDHYSLFKTSDLTKDHTFTDFDGLWIFSRGNSNFVVDVNGMFWLAVNTPSTSPFNTDLSLIRFRGRDHVSPPDWQDMTPWRDPAAYGIEGVTAFGGLPKLYYNRNQHWLYVHVETFSGEQYTNPCDDSTDNAGILVLYDISRRIIRKAKPTVAPDTQLIQNAMFSNRVFLYPKYSSVKHLFAVDAKTLEHLVCYPIGDWGTSDTIFFNSTGGYMISPITYSVLGKDYVPDSIYQWQIGWGSFAGNIFLYDIMNAVLDKCNISAAERDTSDLIDIVIGYTISRQVTGRKGVEPLLQNFFVDGVESQGKLIFKHRFGHGIAIDIPEDDLGAIEVGTDAVKRVIENFQQIVELPKTVIVQYSDVYQDYQILTQAAHRHSKVVSTSDIVEFSTRIVMNSKQAQKVAETALTVMWVSRVQYTIQIPSRYITLDPGDVITTTWNGVVYTIYIMDVKTGANGVIIVSGVAQEEIAYIPDEYTSGIVNDNYTYPDMADLYEVFSYLFDAPLLREIDDSMGFYGVGTTDIVAEWRGAVIYRSSDDVNFDEYAYLSKYGVIGAAVDVLPDHAHEIFDEVNTVTVGIYSGTLESVSKVDVLNGNNIAMLGDELIGFTTAVQIDTGLWELSGLLRGAKGSDWATGLHDVNDIFVLLQPDGSILSQTTEIATLGLDKYYKGVGAGQAVEDAVSYQFTTSGVRIKPLSPVHLDGARSGNDLTVSWIRRTRYTCNWLPGESAPMDEPVEEYEIDIMDGATVVRTLTVSGDTQVVYTEADQITDFGSAQSAVEVNIYQMSARIGRGYAANETV